ncbi:MAG: SOUL family heme-binding protein [Flavobacteriia bacterium]
MSKFIWILSSAVFALTIIVLIMSFTSKNVETPKYEVLKTLDEAEIRLYPSMLVAKTSLADKSFDDQGSNGFRAIAGYIFGGNENNQKIAMTSPVVMNMGDSSSMYFVMPKEYKKEDLPKPSSNAVVISEVAAKTLAVVSYGGYSSDKKIEEHIQKLSKILTKHGLKSKGDFMYMGYNAPWDVINRKNEVAIEIEMVQN